ncbi:MAG: hypothetical protein NTX44_08120 [Ignavibacteriales bacterium]|nr:hypothetical protein [Ignavibacteriales bacterium]
MYERCLNEAELILSVRQEPLAPVRQVWEEIAKRSKTKGFEVASLSDFSAMLEGDNRFQIVPAQIKIQEDEEILPDVEIEDSEMEHLGFFSEDRVKLRSRRIVETVINEDEEEVGSIRRRAFVGQTGNSNNISANTKSVSVSKNLVKKSGKKKTSHQKAKSIKRAKPVKNRKSKAHKRSKK